MRILDRYVLRNFLEPFCLSQFGFLAIWLVFDLADNGNDFIENHVPLHQIAHFYLTQFPAVALLSIPIGVLLALLFSLSKMSRHNEIISMLTAGRSVYRLLVPLLLAGLLCTGACFYLNVEWAPHAEAVKRRMLEEMNKGDKRANEKETIYGHLFRDRMNNRTWYVKRLKPPRAHQAGGIFELNGVEITQHSPDGQIMKKWYSTGKTLYDEATSTWTLSHGMIVTFNKEGDIVFNEAFPDGERVIMGWSETPWRIASSQLDAQNLSIEELHTYLSNNADFPAVQLAPYRAHLADRWAFPWSCIVVIFLAAPLGIVYSRRGVLAGVAGAIALFFALFLLRYLLLALGKGARMDANLAAWLPNASFFILGVILLYYRSSNRELPKLAFWK